MSAAEQQQLAALKAAVAKGDVSAASGLLASLKVKLTAYSSLPPLCEASPHAAAELSLAREVFEQAVLLSVASRDTASFERHFAQLKPLYSDARGLLPPSPLQHKLAGLALLHLLVAGRTSEFHTSLELLSPASLASPHVSYAVNLEQRLMEGAYASLLAGAAAPPDAACSWFIERLSAAVRSEVCACAEAAYDSLPPSAAAALLALPSESEAVAYGAARGWVLSPGPLGKRVLTWPAAKAGGAGAGGGDVPASVVMAQALTYARELERII